MSEREGWQEEQELRGGEGEGTKTKEEAGFETGCGGSGRRGGRNPLIGRGHTKEGGQGGAEGAVERYGKGVQVGGSSRRGRGFEEGISGIWDANALSEGPGLIRRGDREAMAN